MEYSEVEGKNRTQVEFQAMSIGNDLVIHIQNSSAHIGAVALGEYDSRTDRASVSIITRLGHKDDALAQKAALAVSKSTHKSVCVIAGIHVDDITQNEIKQITENAELLVKKFLKQLK